jgi:hypothetical protein
MKSPADMKIIQIEITNGCPKRCSNCTRFCGHHKQPFFMDFETFKQAVDSMKGFKGIVGIMGGEPTIHPEFEKFVRYFRENFGYDDFSTACYEPSGDFVKHILANAYNVNYSNQRGLWTSVSPKYYEHFELIQDTFGYQLVNDHSNPSMHATLMATRKELGIPDDEWVKLRDKCWIQNLWSASITPKGAFFCEVAAAMDATFNGPGGWKVEPGWWKRTPKDFADQLHWCELCSAALPMPKRNANEEVDDVSPVWREKLVQIESPKLEKGLVNEFEPAAYDPAEHDVINEATPYMSDQEQRIGAARKVLLPQRIVFVSWLTESLSQDAAQQIIAKAKSAGTIDVVLSTQPAHHRLSESAGIPFLNASGKNGTELLQELRQLLNVRDWILMARDGVPSKATTDMLKTAVFNPGCIYWRDLPDGGSLQFFNSRAAALRVGGDLMNVSVGYAKRKILKLTSDDPAHYRLNDAQVFYRRAIKRVYWAQKRLGRRIGLTPITTE